MPLTGEINKQGLTFVKGYGWITTERFNQIFEPQANQPATPDSSLPPPPGEEQPTTAPSTNHFVDVTALAHPPTPQNIPPREGTTYPGEIKFPENPPPNENVNPPPNDNYFYPNPPPTEGGTPPFEGGYFQPTFDNTPPNDFGGYPTNIATPENFPPFEGVGYPGSFPTNVPPNESTDYPTPIGAGPTNVPPDENIGYPTSIPQNVPPADTSEPPQGQDYFPSGSYNVPPDETMTATPADVYYLPDGTGGYKVIDSNTGQPVDSIPGSPLPGPETGLPSSPMELPTNPLSETPTVPLIGENPSIAIAPSGSPVGSLTPDAVYPGIPIPGATFGLGSFGAGSIETIGGKLFWHAQQPMFGGRTLAQVAKQNPELLPGLANMGAGFGPSTGWQGTNTGPGGGKAVAPQ